MQFEYYSILEIHQTATADESKKPTEKRLWKSIQIVMEVTR
jgi:hypothetical protein